MQTRVLAVVICGVALAGVALAGCKKDKNTGPPGPVEVAGAVQKGPFILGAQVQVNVLDGAGNPTGTVFNTTTNSEKGEFSVQVTPSVVDLVTDGFYYDETTWSLSGSDISMRALAEITAGGSQQTYVNAITHMTQRRALELHVGGDTVAAAASAAEAELRSVFPIFAPASLSPGVDMNLLGGADDSNAYLLAVSCTLSNTAFIISGGTNTDAELQQLINGIAADLEGGGAVDPQVIDDLGLGVYQDPYECAASLQERLDAIGDTTTVLPDPQTVFDWDHDGIPNATDPDGDDDGTDAADDPVVSMAVNNEALVIVKGGSKRGMALVNRRPSQIPGYWPGEMFEESSGQVWTDVEEVVGQIAGKFAIRRSGGTVHMTTNGDFDATAPALAGVTAATSIAHSLNEELLVVESAGTVTRYQSEVTFNQITGIVGAVNVDGCEPNYVYLDNGGAVRMLEGATSTDVLGLSGLTIVDVAIENCPPNSSYVAATDTGALYRFTAAAPTAVEDTSITGVTAFGERIAVTATGAWLLSGGGASPQKITDVTNLLMLAPFSQAWGGLTDAVYVALDNNGDLQLVRDDGNPPLNDVVRQVYVPR